MTEPSQGDPYEILQVSPNAEPEVIDAAYRRLARKYHPDVDKSPDATERMRLINWAHDILSNSGKRKERDSRGHSQAQSQSSPSNGSPSEQIVRQASLGPDKSCHCWHCGYEWTSRKEHVPPAICPHCRSDTWHTHRRFRCQWCGHSFASGDLTTIAYRLFPNCPACFSPSWHKQEEERRKQEAAGRRQEEEIRQQREEERKKQEEERRKQEATGRRQEEEIRQQREEERKKQEEERLRQEEKRRHEVEIYLHQVTACSPYPAITLLRILALLGLVYTVPAVLFVAIANNSLKLGVNTFLLYGGLVFGLVFFIFLIFLSYLYPKRKMLSVRRLDNLVQTKKITVQEVEWIKKQFPPTEPKPVRPAAQSFRTFRTEERRPTKSSTSGLLTTLIGVVAIMMWLCVKIIIGVLKIVWKVFTFPFKIGVLKIVWKIFTFPFKAV